MKSQFIIVVDGVPQTERNYQSMKEAQREISKFALYLKGKSEVVEYVPK